MNKEYEEEYKQQFREMTAEEIAFHIGLEKVRNVMQGFPEDFGIKQIRRLIKEVQEETPEKRYCKRCNATKDADLFYEDRKYCIRCLEKEKEKYWKQIERKKAYDKAYGQVDEYCAVCECNVKKKKLAKHQKTQ